VRAFPIPKEDEDKDKDILVPTDSAEYAGRLPRNIRTETLVQELCYSLAHFKAVREANSGL
jgi:hypothetical protein